MAIPTTSGIVTRTRRNSGSRPPAGSACRPRPAMLRTATHAVPRMTPLAVEQEAATIADSTSTVRTAGA